MKIAFLIQCHKKPKQINLLLETLEHENNFFFVHVDAKSSIKSEIRNNKNVFILDKCINVKWGQISQVQATLLLFNMVVKTGIFFDYVWLISGEDFPIKSIEFIHNYLKSNHGINFISVYPENKKYHKRNEIYFPLWSISLNLLPRIIRRLWIALSGGYGNTFQFFKRNNLTNRKFFFGSSWFTINHDCMCFILKTIESEPEIMKFYKNTLCPDESFFQTIIMNSHYRDTVKENLVYTDWTNCKNHPRNLDESDFDNLKNTSKLMARKFDNIEILKSLKQYAVWENSNRY
jgi:hypothetical protein